MFYKTSDSLKGSTDTYFDIPILIEKKIELYFELGVFWGIHLLCRKFQALVLMFQVIKTKKAPLELFGTMSENFLGKSLLL